MNNSQASISSEPIPAFVNAVLTAFDDEVIRLSPKEKDLARIFDLFQSLNNTTQFHLFFMASSYQKLVEDIFMDPVTTEFVLIITDRVSMMTVKASQQEDDILIEQLVRAITRNKPAESSASLLNVQLIKSIYQPVEDLTTLLKDNFWLIVVYFLIMFFRSTQLFIQTSEAAGKGKPTTK